jgi:hypothetical protein
MPDYLLNDHTNTAASGAGMLRDGLLILGKINVRVDGISDLHA